LAGDEAARALDGLIGQGAEEVAAVAQPQVPAVEPGAVTERLEELDALADNLDLLGVVELQAKGAGRDGRRQGGERRSTLEDDHAQPCPSREEGGRAAHDPASDDREVSGGRRGICESNGRRGAHRMSLGR
jgi:hypothetical protein